MTVIEHAFRKAGYVAPIKPGVILHKKAKELANLYNNPLQKPQCNTIIFNNPDTKQRLAGMAKQALRAHDGKWDGAKNALLAAVRNDADLLWEMFTPFHSQAAQLVLSKANTEVREELRAKELERAKKSPRQEVKEVGAGHDACEIQSNIARPSTRGLDMIQKRAAEKPKPSAARNMVAEVKFANDIAKLTILDTCIVNGRKVGDLTAREAKEWAGTFGRRVRFVNMLTANLPPNRAIREFIRPDEAEKLWAQSEQADV